MSKRDHIALAGILSIFPGALYILQLQDIIINSGSSTINVPENRWPIMPNSSRSEKKQQCLTDKDAEKSRLRESIIKNNKE